jgi:hypothetical protein
MKIPIFLSFPKPHLKVQQAFMDNLVEYLQGRGLAPRTLGVTDYDMDAPLKAIRRLMLESNGLITVALRRTQIISGIVRPSTDIGDHPSTKIEDGWLTSPYCHIEPAMAYQLGLPVLVFREKGVIADGLLDRGAIGLFMPEFDLTNPIAGYQRSPAFGDIMGKWEGSVRAVVDSKGNPPRLY